MGKPFYSLAFFACQIPLTCCIDADTDYDDTTTIGPKNSSKSYICQFFNLQNILLFLLVGLAIFCIFKFIYYHIQSKALIKEMVFTIVDGFKKEMDLLNTYDSEYINNLDSEEFTPIEKLLEFFYITRFNKIYLNQEEKNTLKALYENFIKEEIQEKIKNFYKHHKKDDFEMDLWFIKGELQKKLKYLD